MQASFQKPSEEFPKALWWVFSAYLFQQSILNQIKMAFYYPLSLEGFGSISMLSSEGFTLYLPYLHQDNFIKWSLWS